MTAFNDIHPKIREAAEGQPCTLRIALPCAPQETVVACHIQRPAFGVVGGKVSDLHVAFACLRCHDIIDRRGDEWRRIDPLMIAERKLAGLIETQLILEEKGIIRIGRG